MLLIVFSQRNATFKFEISLGELRKPGLDTQKEEEEEEAPKNFSLDPMGKISTWSLGLSKKKGLKSAHHRS